MLARASDMLRTENLASAIHIHAHQTADPTISNPECCWAWPTVPDIETRLEKSGFKLRDGAYTKGKGDSRILIRLHLNPRPAREEERVHLEIMC